MNCKKVILELTSYLDGVLDSNMRIGSRTAPLPLHRLPPGRRHLPQNHPDFLQLRTRPSPRRCPQAPAHGAPRALPPQRQDDLTFPASVLHVVEAGWRCSRRRFERCRPHRRETAPPAPLNSFRLPCRVEIGSFQTSILVSRKWAQNKAHFALRNADSCRHPA